MKKSYPLVGITLEGFQVFDKPTYIPLNGLALIFGPNSAGKSAVQDALDLLQVLRSEKTSDYYGVEGKSLELLKKHWRRIDGEDQLVEKLSIGLKCTHDPTADLFELFLSFRRDALAFPETIIFIQSELLVKNEYQRNENVITYNLCVNLSQSVFNKLKTKLDFADIAQKYPELITYQDGLFTILRSVDGFHCSGLGINEMWDRWLSCYFPEALIDKQKNYDPLRKAVGELGEVLGNFLYNCFLETGFDTRTISASRKIPTRDELTFHPGKMKDDFLTRFLPQGNPYYKNLAASLLGVTQGKLGTKLGQDVNRAFTDHLFLEQGFRIDHEYRLLLTKEDAEAIISAKEKFSYEYQDDGEDEDEDAEHPIEVSLKLNEIGYLVELFLRDDKGRRHLFEDVGSGIGYILPVLCEIFDYEEGLRPNCFIQQPELHLHPALQAAMGDVFIEANALGKQILIETHSEHLLLRILKRIRQTHLQVDIAQELKIRAEDVCVLYFDPSPDGTTTVKRLRITEDGEFMDRWPRGFFGERDQELLDE